MDIKAPKASIKLYYKDGLRKGKTNLVANKPPVKFTWKISE